MSYCLLPGRSFSFPGSPATSLGGTVQLLPRFRMKALDAGLPVLSPACLLHGLQPWTIGASASLLLSELDRVCVCWFCYEMKNSSLPLVTGSWIFLRLCVVFPCFFFWNSFIHSFILSVVVSDLPSRKPAFSSWWPAGPPPRRHGGLFRAVVSLAGELGFRARASATAARRLRRWGDGGWAPGLRCTALVALGPWDLPWPGLEPASPPLASGFLSPVTPGKSLTFLLFGVVELRGMCVELGSVNLSSFHQIWNDLKKWNLS